MTRHLIRGLLAALFLCSGGACAAEWAGIPLARLPEAGLGAATLDPAADHWRAPLQDGGFVELFRLADEAAATAVWEGLLGAGSTMAPPVRAPGEAGDASYLLIRDGNVVLRVRSLAGRADVVAASLRGMLVRNAPPGTVQQQVIDGRVLTWDAVGRRVP